MNLTVLNRIHTAVLYSCWRHQFPSLKRHSLPFSLRYSWLNEQGDLNAKQATNLAAVYGVRLRVLNSDFII